MQHVGEPGYVFVTAVPWHGWLTFEAAAQMEDGWRKAGLSFGPGEYRRVEWQSALPAVDESVDAVRLYALQRAEQTDLDGWVFNLECGW